MKETPSEIILFVIALAAFAIALWFLATGNFAPFPLMMSGISAAVGTVALAGTGIIAQLRKLERHD